MSKTIKVDDGVYIALEAIREKRETFSKVIERLIRIYTTKYCPGPRVSLTSFRKERPGGKSEGASPLH